MYRSCIPDVFCKKGVLKDFAKFTEKHLVSLGIDISFLIKLQVSSLQRYRKRESDTGVFL